MTQEEIVKNFLETTSEVEEAILDNEEEMIEESYSAFLEDFDDTPIQDALTYIAMQ